MRRIIAAIILACTAVACTPEEVALFKSLPADQQQAVRVAAQGVSRALGYRRAAS